MIPNFVSFLSAYNQQIDPKIARVRISVQKNFWGKTQALSIFLLPADGTAAVMTPTLTALVARMKSGINLYFSTYPETIDDLASDIYVLELPV